MHLRMTALVIDVGDRIPCSGPPAPQPYSCGMPAGHDVVEREEPAAYAPSGGWRSSTAVLPLAALGVATGAAALGAPTVWLGASLVAISFAWGRGIRTAVESLPSSAVLLVTAGMLGPLAAGAVGLDVLDRSLFARALLVASSWGAVVVAWLLGRDNRANARRSWSEVSLAAIPALVMALLLLVMVSAGNARLSWFLSGDHLRHIGLTTRTLGAGALEYSSQAYPHGWHAVMATMWAATGSRRDGAGLQLLVTLQATATWVVLVLIPLALGLTAATLSRATGLSSRMAGASGLVAGSLVLGPHFYGDYVTRGFDTTLLVLLALIAAVHRSTVAPTSSSALVTAVAAVVVTAHSWQVLLVPACVVSGIVVWRRQSWTRDRRVLRSEVLLLAAGAARLGPGVAGGLRWLRGGCGCRGGRRATARSWVVHRGCRIRGRPGPHDEATSAAPGGCRGRQHVPHRRAARWLGRSRTVCLLPEQDALGGNGIGTSAGRCGRLRDVGMDRRGSSGSPGRVRGGRHCGRSGRVGIPCLSALGHPQVNVGCSRLREGDGRGDVGGCEGSHRGVERGDWRR